MNRRIISMVVILAGVAVADEPEEPTTEALIAQYSRWLDDDDQNRRITAAAKLMEMGAAAETAVPWMKKCAAAEHVPAIAAYITRAYMHIEREVAKANAPPPTPEQIVAILMKLRPDLSHEQPKIRHRALMMLNQLGRDAKPAIEDVRKMAESDEHPTIRAAAKKLLARLEAGRDHDAPTDAPHDAGEDSPQSKETAPPSIPPAVKKRLDVLADAQATAEAQHGALDALMKLGAEAEPAMDALLKFAAATEDPSLNDQTMTAYNRIMLAVARRDAAQDEQVDEQPDAESAGD